MIFKIKKNYFNFFFLLSTICVLIFGCNKEIYGCLDSNADNYYSDATHDDGSCEYSTLKINFRHVVEDSEVVYGNSNFLYSNSMGTNYSISRILYVLSDITLYFENNVIVSLEDILFVNTGNEISLTHSIKNLPGLCLGVQFRIGLSSSNNIDLLYMNTNSDFHNLMLWPNSYGQSSNSEGIIQPGGYHYMKIEGRYINDQDAQSGYNLHTGPINSQDFSFLYPRFNFPPSAEIIITMNINNWFDGPVHDLSSAIMYNLNAQNNLYENAQNVFSIDPE